MLRILTSPQFTDVLSLRAVYEYDLPSKVPLNGTISFAKLAEASGLSETLCRRFLVHAMENGIFTHENGEVRHSAASRMMALEDGLMSFVGFVVADLAPSTTKVFEAFRKYPNSEEPTESGFNVENNTDLIMYAFLGKDPPRAKRFGSGMGYFSSGGEFDLKYLVEAYPWASIDQPGAIVVDLGGGHGQVCKALAASTKNIKFIVQELPGTVEAGQKSLAAHLHERVEYVVGDFFTEQQIIGADVYFFRWILHNWSDGYCVKILQGLVPAMRPNSKVLIYEFVLEEGPVLKCTQKQGRNLDMAMLATFNASERTANDWERLFKLADARFVFVSTTKQAGCALSLVEVAWNGAS